MKVALIYDARLPVYGYGGTERVVWCLAKGLHEVGVEVVLGCRPKSTSPFGKTLPLDFRLPLLPQLKGEKFDLLHFFNTPQEKIDCPYLVTIGGNGKVNESYLPNTVFVSRNHALRHGAETFVWNGVDPADYLFSEKKEGYLAFLAKASWKVKNLKGAISIARKSGRHLWVLGGSHFPKTWRGVTWEGMVGGEQKAKLLSHASALLFPVLWHEPFGIAVIEALVSGTPVLATPFGSLPELVTKEVGALCKNEEEFLAALEGLHLFSPSLCREYALSRFHYTKMTASYLRFYERVLRGQNLNAKAPTVLPQNRHSNTIPLSL